MADEIKRYTNYGGSMVDRNHGEYVGYDDHLEALASLRAENERLKARIEELAAGLESPEGWVGGRVPPMFGMVSSELRSLLSVPDFEGGEQ